MQTGCLGVPEFLHQLQLQTQVKKEKITNRKSIEISIKEENNNKQRATYAGNSDENKDIFGKIESPDERTRKKCEKSNVKGCFFCQECEKQSETCDSI